jgi:NADH:ubiquinone oxidoreductase subunit 6 (subunit J)
MAFYLVMSLGSAAGLFFLAGQDFVGAMQLMIYVGGTLVLLIFGVMLTSQERFINMKPKADDFIWGLFAGGGLLGLLIWAAMSVPEWRGMELAEVQQVAVEKTAAPLGLALLGARVDDPSASGYLLHFEIVSVHLLVVLVGAAYLARAKRRRSNIPEAAE